MVSHLLQTPFMLESDTRNIIVSLPIVHFNSIEKKIKFNGYKQFNNKKKKLLLKQVRLFNFYRLQIFLIEI